MSKPSSSLPEEHNGESSSQSLSDRPVRHYARDDFEFGSLLGIGALAQVVHVRDTHTEDEFALKILDKKQLRRFGKVSQIINEKDMLFKLSHPGIIKLYFTFQDSSWLYLALELCANGELAELIARKGRLPLDLSQFYTGELVNVLTYLRKQGVAHRDIKPENLFITATGHLKLGDFDTAKLVLQNGGSMKTHSNSRTNTFVGTAQYVSPEMLHDSAVAGFGSDLWALGCVVFQMLTGSPPFRSNSEYITFQKILATEYEFPEQTPLIGKGFVSALLVLDPQDRLGFAHMRDLAEHPFLSHLALGKLTDMDPPLTGILKLKHKRIRTSEDEDNQSEGSLLVLSDDEEGERLDDLEFYTLFGAASASPQSPNLVRSVTTGPEDAASSAGSSPQHVTVGPVAPGGLKKAESSPAFLSSRVLTSSRSMINLPILQEEQPSLQRSTSLITEPTTPTDTALLSSVGLPIGSSIDDSSPAIHQDSASSSDVILRMDSLSACSPNSRHQPSAAALHVYLQRICAIDEHVLMSGPVLKRRFFGRNRILVVTDLPRLLVLEPKTFRTLCEIPLLSAPMAQYAPMDLSRLNSSMFVTDESSAKFLSATSSLLNDRTDFLIRGTSTPMETSSPTNSNGLAVTFLSSNDFLIQTGTSTWRGEVRDGTAQAWVSLIQTLKQKAVKSASLRPQRSVRPPVVSPAEVSARDALNRTDFGSVDVLGSVYARGYNSDLPSHAEIEAEAEARVEAAMKMMGDSTENKTAAEIVAALTRQRSQRSAATPQTPPTPHATRLHRTESTDEQEDETIFPDTRRRIESASCSVM